MRKYETIYVVQPDLGEEDIKAVTEKVQDVITSMKGVCNRLEDWGLRKLAYPVRKQARGRYFYLKFEGETTLISELERRLRLDDRVLRYQSVKLEKEIQAPAPIVEKPVTEETAAETTETVTPDESAE